MDDHDELESGHRELLEAVLAGDLAADSPEFVDACRLNPALADQFAKLSRLAVRLQGSAERENAAFARTMADRRFGAEEQEFQQMLRAQLGLPVAPGPRVIRRRLWVTGAAAAAAILAAGYWLTESSPNGDRTGLELGKGEKQPVLPNGQTDPHRLGEFDWSTRDWDPRWLISIRVFDDETREHEIAFAEPDRKHTWSFDPAEVATWPDEIFFVILARDANGVEKSRATGSATRKREGRALLRRHAASGPTRLRRRAGLGMDGRGMSARCGRIGDRDRVARRLRLELSRARSGFRTGSRTGCADRFRGVPRTAGSGGRGPSERKGLATRRPRSAHG